MFQNDEYQDRPWLDPGAEPFIKVQSVTKSFGGFIAVDNVDLDVFKGELFCLLGGSGCGKSTLLRMLAGFETPTRGTIYIDGVDMTEVPAYERPVNMMFQTYALFPHMTVESNVAYGLKRDRVAPAEIAQRQRVALARALVKRPKVLLLDEPLGALDKRLREQTQFELMNIQDQLGVTFIVVTHDQEEAMTLSSRIAVMDAGKFVQIGTPTEIYEFPETRFVANFIGSANMFEGRVVEDGADHVVVRASDHDGEFYIDHGLSLKEDAEVWVAVRPEKIAISKAPADASGPNQLKGVVHDVGYLGNFSTYRVALASGKIVEVTHPNQRRPKGAEHAVDWDDEVHLSWEPSSAVVLTR